MCLCGVFWFGAFGPKLEPGLIYLRGDVRLNCCAGVIFPTLGLLWDFLFFLFFFQWWGLGRGYWEVALRKHPPLMRPTQLEPVCPCTAAERRPLAADTRTAAPGLSWPAPWTQGWREQMFLSGEHPPRFERGPGLKIKTGILGMFRAIELSRYQESDLCD